MSLQRTHNCGVYKITRDGTSPYSGRHICTAKRSYKYVNFLLVKYGLKPYFRLTGFCTWRLHGARILNVITFKEGTLGNFTAVVRFISDFPVFFTGISTLKMRA